MDHPTTSRDVLLFLAGDVMTGRGVDQILPHPGEPALSETYATSALDYVTLAEETNGPIPAPVSFGYPWGAALDELDRRSPHARIVNLETAITRRGSPASKAVNYRMTPENLPVLHAARVQVCSLANNHVLDWGAEGLVDTLDHLSGAGILTAGAGRNREEAEAPAILSLPGGGRLLLFAWGSPTAGVPGGWAATAERPGVSWIPELSRREAERLVRSVRSHRRSGDLVVASLHWGPNWGYGIARAERRFAHRLVEAAGVDLVFGHSSHHPRPMEIHEGRLILYGCGDLLNDYEGISGHEEFRPDLVLAYLVRLRACDGALLELEMVPYRLRRFRLERADPAEAHWLASVLDREGRKLGSAIQVRDDGVLFLSLPLPPATHRSAAGG
jgi:poly-gamma-glutamate capsule biosynthesis protein CapA/YwtB (metallophosphatase superfamily)